MSMQLMSEKLLEREINRLEESRIPEDEKIIYHLCKKELAVIEKLKINKIDMRGEIVTNCRIVLRGLCGTYRKGNIMCEYCKKVRDDNEPLIWDEDKYGELNECVEIRYKHGQYELWSGICFRKINFCPICGRNMTEEK